MINQQIQNGKRSYRYYEGILEEGISLDHTLPA